MKKVVPFNARKQSMSVNEVCSMTEVLLEDIEKGKIPYIEKENMPAVMFAFGRLVDRLMLRARERHVPLPMDGNGHPPVKKFRCGGSFASIDLKTGKCTVCKEKPWCEGDTRHTAEGRPNASVH